MTNQINKLGLSQPATAVDGAKVAREADIVTDTTFDELLVSQGVNAAQDTELHAAVHKIADKIRSGEIIDPAEAVPDVIDTIITLRFAAIDPSVRQQMAYDIRSALMNDPLFGLEVEALLAQALIA